MGIHCYPHVQNDTNNWFLKSAVRVPEEVRQVFMILGQIAATLTVLSIDHNKGLHTVSYSDLLARLLEEGQALEYTE